MYPFALPYCTAHHVAPYDKNATDCPLERLRIIAEFSSILTRRYPCASRTVALGPEITVVESALAVAVLVGASVAAELCSVVITSLEPAAKMVLVNVQPTRVLLSK